MGAGKGRKRGIGPEVEASGPTKEESAGPTAQTDRWRRPPVPPGIDGSHTIRVTREQEGTLLGEAAIWL